VNFKAANIVYLTHPAARSCRSCRGKNHSTELYAKGDRRPKPEFYKVGRRRGRVVFTVTKDDTTTGTTRCPKRMGSLRGDKITRLQAAQHKCTRTKTDRLDRHHTRGKDE
jgi:hypothetical protein